MSLTQEENEVLTRVGPGTVMGNLLRRYWTPACLSVELPDNETSARVRLFGEDLVAFRTTDGTVGLIEEHCPHRGASLYYGRNEENGLRCVYHGWKFDTSGQCVDMPSERRSFADQIKATAYPTHESGGVVWAYLGPQETMTPFRDFGTDTLPAENVVAIKMHSTCNWVQSMEGNIDPVHISFLHQYNGIDDIPDDGSDKPGYPSNFMSWKFWRHDRTPRIELEEYWYGYRYASIRETPMGHRHVRINAFVFPFNTLVASIPFSTTQGLFVPIDDESCWRYLIVTQPPANPRNLGGPPLFAVPNSPYSNPLRAQMATGISPRLYTAENEYQIDRAGQRESTYTGINDFVSQDLMVTETMKPIYDRTKEHLGTTDLAIIKMRSLLIDAAIGLSEGEEPPAVGADLDYRGIRVAEKILASDEDWRVLGTDADPVVRDAAEAAGV